MALNNLPAVIWPLALATFAIAFVATAFVQLLKELLPIRRRFQRSYLTKWFTARLKERGRTVTNEQLERAERDLIHLATGGDRNAFYDLETAQLCGQMNSAAQIALAYPDRHPDLLRFLAPEAEDPDIERILQTASFPAQADMPASPQAQADMNELLDARNRVTHHIQRTIDALQISMSFRWKLYLQLTVYSICLVLSLITILTTKGASRFSWLEILVMAVVAGYISPVISDLAGFVERLRKR